MRLVVSILLIMCGIQPVKAQERSLFDSLSYRAELQATFSGGDNNPLWLNANKYGLSSLKHTNGYLRGSLARPLALDDGRKWGIGYGTDVALATGFTSTLIVQQTYVEGRWLKGTLTIGAKEQPMELKNQELSSGSQTLGINARPIPQVRLALPEYWTIPCTKQWLALKGHIAYGKTTDDGWQKDFTNQGSKYVEKSLYHSKAGYLRIGKEERPFSLELGVEMGCQFGGTSYMKDTENTIYYNNSGLSGFLHALIPSGGEVNETIYQNDEGNHLGSWLIRLNYQAGKWGMGLYVDKYFEDHSGMFMLDYDGYGDGDSWNVKENNRYLLYDFKDFMLGAELYLPSCFWVNNLVLEYVNTKYQSGPVYHDRTPSFSDHIGGIDDYYNHSIFTGWQHWGQVMGNPFYLSPLYDEKDRVYVSNNRFNAFHMGLSGQPIVNFHYRILVSWQNGLGTYRDPYIREKNCASLLFEAVYSYYKGWSVKGALGADFGSIRGDNYGFQLTLSKEGVLHL